ncbi:MAG TPA: anti-sigma factor [Myxococcales bacterium]
MTCAEFRELAALYAAGGLGAEERAAAEAHLEEPKHEGCFEALRHASAGVETLARSLVPVRPDDRVWRGIEAQLGVAASRRMGWRERSAWGIAAAAALLLFASLSRQRQESQKARNRENQLAAMARNADEAKAQCLAQLASMKGESDAQRAALALLQSPSAQVVSLSPQPGKPPYSARALLDLPQKKGMLLSGTLSPQAGKDYQLWVIRGKEPPVPAGLLRAGSSGTVLASIDPRLLAIPPDALAVSIEPQGGSPSGLPTGDIVLVGALPKT